MRKAIYRAAKRGEGPVAPVLTPRGAPAQQQQHTAYLSPANSHATPLPPNATNSSVSVTSSSSAMSSPSSSFIGSGGIQSTSSSAHVSAAPTAGMGATGGFGTALFLLHNELMQQLWHNELELVSMDRCDDPAAPQVCA